MDDIKDIQKKALEIRSLLIKVISQANYGYLGSCCSCLDIVICLGWLNTTRCFDDKKRKANLILSKGHAALALYLTYINLADRKKDIMSYSSMGSVFQAHPNSLYFPPALISSGSLGLSFPAALGYAIGEKINSSPRRTFVICGDGEMQTGIVWETLMICKRLMKQPALTVIIDANKYQSTGKVAKLKEVRKTLKAIGFYFLRINGNDIKQIVVAINKINQKKGISILWADTKRGAGLKKYNSGCSMSTIPLEKNCRIWEKDILLQIDRLNAKK